MTGIGHNRGPELTGTAWRRHCWQAARARLLPVLPVEVVRLRVARAKALGLDYKTYAGVRSTTGHDIIAFLFSSNALRVDAMARIPTPEAARLTAVAGAVHRLGLMQGAPAARLLLANPGLLEDAGPAPGPWARFAEQARDLRAVLGKLPGDQVVLIGSDAPWERDWLAAGRLAGVVPAARWLGRAA